MCNLSKPQNTTCITPSKGNGTGRLYPPHRDRPVLAQRPEHSSCTLVISLSQQLWAVLWSRHTSLLRPRCCSEPLRWCTLCPRCLSNKSFPMPAVSRNTYYSTPDSRASPKEKQSAHLAETEQQVSEFHKSYSHSHCGPERSYWL